MNRTPLFKYLAAQFLLLAAVTQVNADFTATEKYLDSACTRPLFLTVSQTSCTLIGSPTTSTCSATGGIWQKGYCTSKDPLAHAAAFFGKSPYVLVVPSTNTRCLWSSSPSDTVAHLADGSCMNGKCTSVTCYVRATLKADGSATLAYYTDALCATTPSLLQIPAASLSIGVCISSKKYYSNAVATVPTAEDRLMLTIANHTDTIAQLKAQQVQLVAQMNILTAMQETCSSVEADMDNLVRVEADLSLNLEEMASNRTNSIKGSWKCEHGCAQAQAVATAAAAAVESTP